MSKDLAVTPRSWSTRGEAALTVQGRRILVWQGIVGEHELVRITQSGMNRDYAVWRASSPMSPHRVDPPCDRYHTCGGCPMMHVDTAGQHAAKRELVAAALATTGLKDIEISGVTTGPDGEFDYRHVVKLGVGYSDIGRLRVGAWGRHTRTIVPIPNCLVATDPLRHAMASVAHHVIDLNLTPYDPETDRGLLRTIVLRQSRSHGEVFATIVAGRRAQDIDAFAERLLIDKSPIQGVALHLNTDPGNAIFVPDDEGIVRFSALGGKRFLTEVIDGIELRIDPGTFFQTNPGMAERLYARALELMALDDTTPLVDLYCGVGPITLLASRITGWAHGVEVSPTAIEAARESARKQKLPATFTAAPALDALPGLTKRLAAARPVLCVNPARRGLEDGVIPAIAELRPRRIAYISCNPSALARDLVNFAALGFHTRRIELFDMFPHTAHVECLALLSSDDDTPPTAAIPRRRRITAKPNRGKRS